MNRLIITFLAVSFLTTCCKDDGCLDPTNPNCENYDPCYGKSQYSAKFNIESKFRGENFDIVWLVDSQQLAGYTIRYSSNLTDKSVKHTWYVGSEIFNTSTTPERTYDHLPRPQIITVSHVIEYTPDLQCFPDDIGKDSVAQSFKLIAAWNDLKIFGTFRALLEGTTDSFDINFTALDFYDAPAYFSTREKVRTINFYNDGDTLFSNSNYNRLVYGGVTDHFAYTTSAGDDEIGIMQIDANNRFSLFYYRLENGFYKKYNVTGRKLN